MDFSRSLKSLFFRCALPLVSLPFLENKALGCEPFIFGLTNISLLPVPFLGFCGGNEDVNVDLSLSYLIAMAKVSAGLNIKVHETADFDYLISLRQGGWGTMGYGTRTSSVLLMMKNRETYKVYGLGPSYLHSHEYISAWSFDFVMWLKNW